MPKNLPESLKFVLELKEGEHYELKQAEDRGAGCGPGR